MQPRKTEKLMKLEESITIMKALADNSRLMIMNALQDRPQYVEELSERLELAVSTVSFHLKKLEKAGLVRRKKEQYYVMFHTNQDALNMSLRELIGVKDIEKESQGRASARISKKSGPVLFSERQNRENALLSRKNDVSSWRKSPSILKQDAPYQEQEINEIILNVHDDYCTARREMIGWNMLAREGDLYRRLESDLSRPSLLPMQNTLQREDTMDRRKETKTAIQRCRHDRRSGAD